MLENKEVWRDCKGYEGKYQVSTFGRVWSIKNQKYLKPMIDRDGYEHVVLYAKNGKGKDERVHRLVALAFITNPEKYPQVNHKDENPSNNNVNNLEWCTNKYNVNYGTRNKRAGEKNSRPVFCEELNKTFKSMTEAAEELKVHHPLIYACCNGIQKTTGGYHFRYAD